MGCTCINVHNVVSIHVERIEFPTFHSLRFCLTTEDGSTVELDAFSAEPLTLADVPSRMANASALEAA